jgi:hypothetical protein
MFHTTPATITNEVLAFCRSITKKHDPVFIDVKPDEDAVSRFCFSSVDAIVAKQGGKRLTGWVIWYRPGVFIEAEHHAVWLDPRDNLVDITPPPSGESTILFLRDDNALPFEKTGLNSRRKALNDDPLVKEFVKLGNAQGNANVVFNRTGKMPAGFTREKMEQFMFVAEAVPTKYGDI